MTDRLSKSDWIKHGLRTLTKGGPQALKVGAMADGLKVSRGSFYWHFSDIADFKIQLMRSWQTWATDEIIAQIEAEQIEPLRLRRLLRLGLSKRRPGLERAIRSWAAEDKKVADVVAAIDARRVAYIAKLLIGSGVHRTQARPRATFLYWAYLGQYIVMDARLATIPDSALDDIGGVFTR